MIFSTSFSKTSLKRGRLGGVHMGGMTTVKEAVNISRGSVLGPLFMICSS